MYQITVYLHILSVIVWVGGALFLALVIITVNRRLHLSPPQSAALLGNVARRYRTVSWSAIGLLVATGLYVTLVSKGLTPLDIMRGRLSLHTRMSSVRTPMGGRAAKDYIEISFSSSRFQLSFCNGW